MIEDIGILKKIVGKFTINMNLWLSTDPRLSINKRANIVIIDQNNHISTAHVDTKEVWCIFSDDFIICDKKEWDQNWKWTWGPHKGKYDWCPWKNTDPRLNSDENIVIINGCNRSSFGYVDNEKFWSVKTSYEAHQIIDAFDDWDQDWWWLSAPSKK